MRFLVGAMRPLLTLCLTSIALEALAEPSAPVGLLVNGVSIRWEKSASGRFSLSVIVPPNTRATVYIPKFSPGNLAITESGKFLRPVTSEAKDPGVLNVSEDDSSIKCLVSAGDCQFCEVSQNSK
jgi:hypothetical protein